MENLNLLNAKVMTLYLALLEKENKNAYEIARLTKIDNMLSSENAVNDSGINGKIFEILTVKETSHKKAVASQNKNDGYFTFNGKSVPVEKKTNGGRIGNLFTKNGNIKQGFIVYSMCFDTRQTYKKDGTPRPTKHYETEDLIFTYADFIAILEHCNATKVISHKGQNDSEIAVQGDSVKLYKVLSEYPIVFNPEYKYTNEDFENLELW